MAAIDTSTEEIGQLKNNLFIIEARTHVIHTVSIY